MGGYLGPEKQDSFQLQSVTYFQCVRMDPKVHNNYRLCIEPKAIKLFQKLIGHLNSFKHFKTSLISRKTEQNLPKDVGHFLQSQCLYPKNTSIMSMISPEPHFRAFQNLVSEHSVEGVPASLYNLTKSVPDHSMEVFVFFHIFCDALTCTDITIHHGLQGQNLYLSSLLLSISKHFFTICYQPLDL